MTDSAYTQHEHGGRLRLSAEVARLVAPETSEKEKYRAVAGHLPLSMHDQVMLWYVFYSHTKDDKIKHQCLEGLEKTSTMALKEVLRDPQLNVQILEFILLARSDDLPTLIILRPNPVIPEHKWLDIFRNATYEVLSFFLDPVSPFNLTPAELRAMASNHQATSSMQEAIAALIAGFEHSEEQKGAGALESGGIAEEKDEEDGYEEVADDMEAASKYQIVQELGVGDKIKIAMTGDKEWRSLLLKDSNKQVSSAVLKNPRITEKEILMLCQNRSTNDELIRIILLNREWLKNYSIRLALTMHPRTPLNQAIRFLSTLGEKDLRKIAKSRNVATAVVNACRRILASKSRY